MALFKVIEVSGGDTIKVSPTWKWNNKEGNIVRIYGYLTPKSDSEISFAKGKLEKLLLNKEIELRDPYIPDNFPEGAIVCRVFRNSVDVSRYFPEFVNF